MQYIAIVPAAGSGNRMGAGRPKQYLALLGRPLLWHALHTLTRVPRIDKVCVVLAPDDDWWPRYDWSALGEKLQPLFVGGTTRAASVTNALKNFSGALNNDDWILVHDAARACVTVEQVDDLIETLAQDTVGGLLAVPVADTLKRATAEARVAETVAREGLWQAQTPQMFRYGLLLKAMQAKLDVTDEAGAIEALGYAPRLVAADATNFKVTYPQDMVLADQVLRTRKLTSHVDGLNKR